MFDIWKSFCYTEVQKSRAYGYRYYSYKVLSLVQLLAQYFQYFSSIVLFELYTVF